MSRFWGYIGINKGIVESGTPGVVEYEIERVRVSGEIRNARLSWPNANARERLSAQHVLSLITPEDSDIDYNGVVYVEWHNTQWAVTAIQYNRPRLELTMGGLYNG